MIINRPFYLDRLVSSMRSDQVKVITGIRRCGKSFLVFNLFKQHLIEQGVHDDHIIEMAFDRYGNRAYRDARTFYDYVTKRLSSDGEYFVLLDEVQLLEDFADILIDLIARENVDVYVTGSNAKLLSHDVVTEFRGRGDEISMAPLSFSEFMTAYEGDKRDGYLEYVTFGGLPGIFNHSDSTAKTAYLENLLKELYISDIIERNKVRDRGNLEELVGVLASGIGSLTNPRRIANTFKSEKQVTISAETIDAYISYLEDAFLVKKAVRYDVKGKRYISTPAKYYFTDLGVRNALMNFRQLEETHLMENVIYNELIGRGFKVDVGVVPVSERDEDGKTHRSQLEIDFVCNKGSQRCYAQSAFDLPTPEKLKQEQRSLLQAADGFKKVIITKEGFEPHYNEQGILMMNVYDFLLNRDSLSV